MTKPVIAALLVCIAAGCRPDTGEARRPTEPDHTIKTVPPPETEPEQPEQKDEDSTMEMTVRKATEEEIEKLGIKNWPIWAYDPSAQPPSFDWHYDSREICYIIEGEVTVEAEGQSITFGPGDIVEFPKDLDCVWKVDKAVRKHYKFE